MLFSKGTYFKYFFYSLCFKCSAKSGARQKVTNTNRSTIFYDLKRFRFKKQGTCTNRLYFCTWLLNKYIFTICCSLSIALCNIWCSLLQISRRCFSKTCKWDMKVVTRLNSCLLFLSQTFSIIVLTGEILSTVYNLLNFTKL